MSGMTDGKIIVECEVFGCTWTVTAPVDVQHRELSEGEVDWIRGRLRREREVHMQAHAPTFRFVDGPMQGRLVDSAAAEELQFLDDDGREVRYYRTAVADAPGAVIGHVYSVHAVLATCRRTPREMLGLYPEWKDRLNG